jgi:hypothetical protein
MVCNIVNYSSTVTMVKTRRQDQNESDALSKGDDDGEEVDQQPKMKQAKLDEMDFVNSSSKRTAMHGREDSEAVHDNMKREPIESTSSEESDDEGDPEAEIFINRAPVLTLWVSVVAERLGYSVDEAYTYGRWVSGTLAATKGRKLGIFETKKKKTTADAEGRREAREVHADHVKVFSHMKIPVKKIDGKLLAFRAKQTKTIQPDTVRRYLESKFGDNLDKAHDAMMELAQSMPAEHVRERAYELYEKFRPEWHGWGKKGTLDLEEIHDLAEQEASGI